MTNFDPNSVLNLVGLWDFRAGDELADTGLDDGVAQNGWLHGDATIGGHGHHPGGDRLHLDGNGDYFDVDGEIVGGSPGDSPNAGDDDPFDMSKGTIEVQFVQHAQVGSSPDTLVNRGEYDDRGSEGYFSISIQADGSIKAIHYANGNEVTLVSDPGLAAPGDSVNVKYSWDDTAGVQLEVANNSTGASQTLTDGTTGLTMEIGDEDDESFTFGAREDDDGTYDKFFHGTIDYVAVYEAPAPGPDGAVDGEASGELMELGYDDSNAPTNQGGDLITEDGDLIFGNGGDDTIDGAGGDDTIYGDLGAPGTPSHEIFQWRDAPGFDNDDDDDDDTAENFTQNTGSANISFSILNETGGAVTGFQTNTQNTDLLDPEVDENASLASENFKDSDSAAYQWQSDTPLTNVEFRINDIDGDGRVRVEAYDADGNPIEVILSDAGAGLTLSDTDGVAGNDTAASNDDNYTPDAADEHSVLVTIPGPVVTFRVIHEQDGPLGTGINVTDITFDVAGPDLGVPGDDLIYGDEGDDLIFGQQGDDEVYGGDGDDTISGGEGDDRLDGDAGNDLLDGGAGNDEVEGGEGDDTLLGSDGQDTVDGDGGRDTYIGQADETIVVNVDDEGNGTLEQLGDGSVQQLKSMENFIAPEDSPEADEITLTTAVPSSQVGTQVQGLSDDSVGQFTAPGGAVIAFGPAEDYLLSNLLQGTSPGGGLPAYGPVGQFTITDGDEGGQVGDISFDNFETINFTVESDAPGPVDGLDSGEVMNPGYTDLQGDQIDGTDGNDDTIFGNGGDDTIDSGLGDDTVDGGGGDDTFLINDEGGGIDNDVIIGGETDENDGGDRLDALAITDDLLVEITAPETGTVTDGTDTISFEEIEFVRTGSGDDTVIGSSGDDRVAADGGDDTMDGGDGDDTLWGGDGNDTMDGGDGDDSLSGGSGDNLIDGGDGDDSIDAGSGDDTITGGDGSDTVEGGSGDNVIDTSGGAPLPDIGYPGLYGADPDPDDDRDVVTTLFGNDSITTGDDADTISSGAGHDTIDSGIDDDVVDASAGDDLVISGEGNDSVIGGSGNDTIYGGTGNPGDPINIPDDGSGPFGPDLRPNNGMDTLDGGAGHDVIYGEDDDDLIFGGGGADTLDGGVDDDTIYGGAGKDQIIGGQGADSLIGGADRDTFQIDNREDAFGDVVDGSTTGNDVDTLDLRGLGRFEIVGETLDADGDSTSGTVNFLASDGTVEGSMTFSEIERLYICFTPGVRIATPRGEVAVQDLRAGDRVITRDDGVQEIHWIGRRKLAARDLVEDPSLRPVLIRKGSLGNNLPERDLMVSPNHRMLVANHQTQMLFDEREVLVAAKHLVGQPGVHRVDTLGTEYIHLMFERHEVILGDGAWTESFQPGDYSINGIDAEQREEIFKLFPGLKQADGRRAYRAARQSLKAHEARMLKQTMAAE